MNVRLLRLLSLLQARREWAGAELAERLGVDARTVRRDIEKLRALDYPVHATAGVAGYRLGRGGSLPPLLLDDDEAVAVAVGLRTAAGGTVAGIEETSVRALAKLEQVLPSALRHRVNALSAATMPMNSGGPPIDPDVLVELAIACRDHLRLRFDYRSHTGEATLRNAEPYRLVYTTRQWYLVAYDLDRSGWRTFRVDRLTLWTPTGPRFTPRPDPPTVTDVSQGITTNVYRYQARFTLHVPLAVAQARIPPTIGHLVAVDEERCQLSTGSQSLDELALYVGLYGFAFEVHEPPELIEHIHALAARLATAVGPQRS